MESKEFGLQMITKLKPKQSNTAKKTDESDIRSLNRNVFFFV